MEQRNDQHSYWNCSADPTSFPTLSSNESVDIAIIGAGTVGITTARLLKNQGLTVAVVEAHKAVGTAGNPGNRRKPKQRPLPSSKAGYSNTLVLKPSAIDGSMKTTHRWTRHPLSVTKNS